MNTNAEEVRARRLYDWVIAHIWSVGVMVLAIWVFLGVMGWGIVAANRNAAKAAGRLETVLTETRARSSEEREVLKRGIQCIVDQLFEHRVNNDQAHAAIGDVVGAKVMPPTPVPKPVTEDEIVRVCDGFLGK